MSALSAADFPAFFQAIHGYPPFPWQTRLLRQVADQGVWPSLLDLPTGSGKTAAIDVAVFHLALEASKGAARKAACRICFIVDRRLIVDDAHARAETIAKAVNRAGSGEGVLRRVHDALAFLAEPKRADAAADAPHEVLSTQRLRGGVEMDRDLARTPSQPTIYCSTVDQIGSRLLFRGYGVSDRMKPVHAGLLGGDTLYLLDEVQLAEPFHQTLKAVEDLRTRRTADYKLPPFKVVSLSATPGVRPDDRFPLDANDHADPVLSARLNATKRATLVEAPAERGKTEEQQRVAAILQHTIRALEELQSDSDGQRISKPAIAVVVNRVGRARQVFSALRKNWPGLDHGDEGRRAVDLKLIIGPSRAIDRANIADALEPIRTKLWTDEKGWRDRLAERPLILVATQTIEAGVDIDLDGLVTEAAALDSLRQRFGRLNRGAREGLTAVAAVVAHKADVGKKAADPVYGLAAGAAWDWLNGLKGETGAVDFGINAMDAHVGALTPDALSVLLSPRGDAPTLMSAHVDLYAQTSPIPLPKKVRDLAADTDPHLPAFLHGHNTDLDGVRIVWRADIETRQSGERVAAILSVAPPVSGEGLEVGFPAAKAWLNGAFDDADSSDAAETDPDADLSGGLARRAYRWRGRDDDGNGWIDPRELRPGDTIVVPVTHGGCDQYGWFPSRLLPVRDVGQVVRENRTGQVLAVAIRLNRQTIFNALQNSDVPAEDVPERLDAADAALREILEECREFGAGRLLDELRADPRLTDGLPDTFSDVLRRAVKAKSRLRRYFVYDDAGEALTGVVFATPPSSRWNATITGDDRLGSTPGFVQGLDQHLEQVRDKAATFADVLGLDPAIASDVALAGHLHDLGKADRRFQLMLYGGDAFAALDRLRAKSDRRMAGAWERAGLPKGWRHEALSVRMALAHPLLASAADRLLVLWLIGTHHGLGRPFFPHDDADDRRDRDRVSVLGAEVTLRAGQGPQSLAFEIDDLNWLALFETLKRRYGAWELARLEAIVRLADHRASEEAWPMRLARDAADGGDEADAIEEAVA